MASESGDKLESTAKTMNYLAEVEALAETILTDKQQIVEFDQRRNENRLALKALKDESNEKSWICFGHTFVKLESKLAKDFINQEQTVIENEISECRTRLKEGVKMLDQLEGRKSRTGFDLEPLSKQEMNAVQKIIE